MITIVSGLPRSGTSLAMQALAGGGMPVLTDRRREADANNPRGYFEFARVLRLGAGDTGWRADAEDRAVKITWPLLAALPADWNARVIWMQRPVAEIVASQARMLGRNGQRAEDAAVLMRAFAAMHAQARAWLAARRTLAVFDLNYHELVTQPATESARLAAWLGGELDVSAMTAAVDPTLWRERSSAR
jgi:hypothetical protein